MDAGRSLVRLPHAGGFHEGRDPLARHARDLLAPYAHRRQFGAGSLLWREDEDTGLLVAIFTRTVFAWQRRVARRRGAAEPRTAGVTAVQRAGGAVNLNVHFHTLVPDGVFELDGATARFLPLPPPQDDEVEAILRCIVRRVAKALIGYGGDLESETDALCALQAAEVDRRRRQHRPRRAFPLRATRLTSR